MKMQKISISKKIAQNVAILGATSSLQKNHFKLTKVAQCAKKSDRPVFG